MNLIWQRCLPRENSIKESIDFLGIPNVQKIKLPICLLTCHKFIPETTVNSFLTRHKHIVVTINRSYIDAFVCTYVVT